MADSINVARRDIAHGIVDLMRQSHISCIWYSVHDAIMCWLQRPIEMIALVAGSRRMKRIGDGDGPATDASRSIHISSSTPPNRIPFSLCSRIALRRPDDCCRIKYTWQRLQMDAAVD